MNDKMKHILFMMMSAVLTASCSQDALDEGQDTALPEGAYPLELTAGGLQAVATPATRGTVDGNWEGAKTVAVRVNGNIKEYTATGSATATLTGIDITDADTDFWWTKSGESKTVDAWYPYMAEQPGDWSVSLEQTETTIADEDLMYASSTQVTQTRSTIQFEHMLAKVIINLAGSDYLKNASKVEVSLTGQYKTASIYTGFYLSGKGLADNTITPYELPSPNDGYYATYQALVIPLASGNPCIRINVEGTEYSYTIVQDVGSIFTGGYQYTFNITVRAEGLNVYTYKYPTWEEGSSENIEIETN